MLESTHRRPPLFVVWGLFACVSCLDTDVGVGISAVEYCRAKAAVDCDVYWNCFTIAERADVVARRGDIGQSEESCVAMLGGTCAQQPFSCPANHVFQEMKAAACIDAYEVLSCEAWQDETEPPQPVACSTLCLENLK